MDDAGAVSSGERAGDLRGDIKHFAELQWRDSHPLAQRLAIDKLGRDEMRAFPHRPTPSGLPAWGPRCRATAPLVDLVNRNDVRMVKRRSSLCLLNEAAHPLLIGSHLNRQNLQRNLAIEFRVLGKIHLTHPSRAK